MTEKLSIHRLEQYTLRFPEEVLMINAVIADEEDCVLVFRGFSSSLVRPTAFDPEVPVLSEDAVINTVDRLQGPYMPENPQYLEQAIAWSTFANRLTEMGL